MRRLKMMLVMFGACCLVAGCGEDSESACARQAKIMEAGLSEGCQGRDDECWHCDCDNQGLRAHAEAGTTGVVWSCIPKTPEVCEDNPETEEDECGCEGDNLLNAEHCLADEDECKQLYIDMQNSSCVNTLK